MTCRIATYTIAKNEAKHVARWSEATQGADYRLWLVDGDSTDDTAALARAAGIVVVERTWGPTFRFDYARNHALDCLPGDIDLCVSLDADEVLDEGFLDTLREAWDATGGFDKAHPWFNTGTWWRCDRVHGRRGWRWILPCHEVTRWNGPAGADRHIDLEATMRHLPDDSKPRSGYVDLLRLGCTENPGDARMAVYLARQLWFDGAPATAVLEACEHALPLGPDQHEGAFLCRIAGDASRIAWLERGAYAYPAQAEAWAPLAQHHYERSRWAECFTAAVEGLNAPVATHYLADQAVRGWRLADFAAVAADKIGRRDDAVAFGYTAWDNNALDGRLATNLRHYVAEAGVPTYVVIPQKPGERDLETARAAEAFRAQGAVDVYVDDSDDPIHAKWNAGIDRAAYLAGVDGHDRWNVIVSNNDVHVADGTVVCLAAALRSGPDVGAASAPSESGFAGWLFALRGEDAWTIDERFAWWQGDTDLAKRILLSGKRIVQPPIAAMHLHPNESTFTDPERLALAMRDEAAFCDKWPDVDPATLFFARNPELAERAAAVR